MPKSVFASPAEEEAFLQLCFSHGLELRTVPVTPVRPRTRLWLLLLAVSAIVMCLYSFFPGSLFGSEPADIGGEFYRNSPARDTASLEQLFTVLTSLGFQIGDDLMAELAGQAEEIEGESFLSASPQGTPYISLLIRLALPQYDPDTLRITAYSDQAYWFDWEAYGLLASYEDLLTATERLSGGELTLRVSSFDTSRVNWEQGSGTLKLQYTCNGRPYEMKLHVSSDWMDDTTVIRKLNKVLKQENASGRIYACRDDGQEAILFYKDAAWARQFEELTGIPPEKD